MSPEFEAVGPQELEELIRQPATRVRQSKGRQAVERLLQSEDVGLKVSCASTKERNALALSANSYIHSSDVQVWVRKTGPNQLTLIAVQRAPASVVDAYEKRAAKGRRNERTR